MCRGFYCNCDTGESAGMLSFNALVPDCCDQCCASYVRHVYLGCDQCRASYVRHVYLGCDQSRASYVRHVYLGCDQCRASYVRHVYLGAYVGSLY